MEVLTITYLLFCVIALYFSFLLLLLSFKNEPYLMETGNLTRDVPSLTVLVPAFNEEGTISDTIKSLLNSDYPKDKLEIIVINDGSTDNTAKIVREFKGVKLFDKENTGKANSINQAIKKAKGDLIAIVDADSFPEELTLLKLANLLIDKKVGGVTSCILARNKKTFLEKLQAVEYTVIVWARKLFEFVDSVSVTPGACSMYRKSAVVDVGGFDEENITEDIEICWNLISKGYKIRMNLSAFTWTSVPTKFKVWWNQRVRWYIGGMQTLFKYKRTLFNPNYGMMGLFISPALFLSLFLTMLGFIITLIIFSKKLLNLGLFVNYSNSVNSALFDVSRMYLLPTVFLIFGVVLFVIGTYFVRKGLKIMHHAGMKFTPMVFFYMFVYLPFFAILLLVSIYKLFTGEIKW
jgi:cellulose synthase/poly-beta-1,6-N-acetylglucosamine synthase-like glycosyltransferase